MSNKSSLDIIKEMTKKITDSLPVAKTNESDDNTSWVGSLVYDEKLGFGTVVSVENDIAKVEYDKAPDVLTEVPIEQLEKEAKEV